MATGDLDLPRQRVLSVGGMRIGHTDSGVPAVGKFHVGDVNVDLAGPYVEVCTAAGTPGTWANLVAKAVSLGPPITSEPGGNVAIGTTYTSACELTIAAGLWLVTAAGEIAATTAGDQCSIQVYDSTAATGLFSQGGSTTADGAFAAGFAFWYEPDSSRTIQLRGLNLTATRGSVYATDPISGASPCTILQVMRFG